MAARGGGPVGGRGGGQDHAALFETLCGTRQYIAPEILAGRWCARASAPGRSGMVTTFTDPRKTRWAAGVWAKDWNG